MLTSIVSVLTNLISLPFSKLLPKRKPGNNTWRHRFILPMVEALEDRWCPAVDMWLWNGPIGQNSNWSNGANWLKNNVPAAATDYPGKVEMGVLDDDFVEFTNLMTGSATLDVALGNSLRMLDINGWRPLNSLTLNFTVTVSGANGYFRLADNAVIQMANNAALNLTDLSNALPVNLWTNGSITGGPNNSFTVTSSFLQIKEAPLNLGVDLSIRKSGGTAPNGVVQMVLMTRNLTLSAFNNYIDVGDGGELQLYQHIAVAGQENTRGRIEFGMVHAGTDSVQVQVGGRLVRGAVPDPGIPDQVSIPGTVYNLGGTVEVVSGSMLRISSTGPNNYSYWQKDAGSALLKVDVDSNISAAGSFQIDIGTLKLIARDGATRDMLDGDGLEFGNANATLFTIDDWNGTPGTVVIQGSVTLGALTTTTMNFEGGNNRADQLVVVGGPLILDGGLFLKSSDGQKPTQALDVFADIDVISLIAGDFALIWDNLGDIYDGEVIPGNPEYYRVTMIP